MQPPFTAHLELQDNESWLIQPTAWPVQRFGAIKEVKLNNGAIRFHVEIWDQDRKPFLTRWFNDPVPAEDFLEQVKNGFDPRTQR